MEEEPDFEEISKKIGVKETVIEDLFNLVPCGDVFDKIISTNSYDVFWENVDSLPCDIAMHLHATELEVPTSSNDFPDDCLSPTLQTFWAAHCISQGIQPTSVNGRACAQVDKENLKQILGEVEGWEETEDGNWNLHGCIFSPESLCKMCNANVTDGSSWLFSELEDLRQCYIEVSKILESLDRKYMCLKFMIENSLRHFEFGNNEEISAALKPAGEFNFPQFSVSHEVCEGIAMMLEASKDFILSCTQPPILGKIDDWTISRSDALVSQMALPLHQRSAFVLTPQILQSRCGMPIENAFEPFSIAELLFCDSHGNAYPMPYSSCKAELPSGSPMPFCRSVFKRFLGRELIKYGYKSATEQAVDVLSDVLINEVKKVSQVAVQIHQSNERANLRDCFLHSLEVNGYDVNVLFQEKSKNE
ncbi:hypothetical protein GPJ56_004856 [Histomonas meleagridis]|uniref:uncharacterized protein n=1 Tax=Histomonas meleagridis TaxID=135588 RepID=UPI0035594CD8|nr:hypothetical protein GPJ56_004856 [Histomonas meleagridis]KAH0803506.1 hypothetical protein GO595_003850 [Histomonas meleagridis]